MSIGSPRLVRHLALESLFNVRDLGGYTGRAGQTLRWNRIYRADDLSRAGRADLVALSELGVRTVIDLRTAKEAASTGPLLFPGARIEQHHLPMLRDTWDRKGLVPRDDDEAIDFLVERYVEMLVEGAPSIADALRIMALPSAYPVVFHCALGKDRTGLLAAVLLALLGVHDETIAEDYALSSLAVTSFDDWLLRNDSAGREALWQLPGAYLAAPPAAMMGLLERVRTNSRSMVGFVRSIGVPFEVVEDLHRHLLV